MEGAEIEFLIENLTVCRAHRKVDVRLSSTPQPALVVIRGEASVAEFAAVDLTDAGPARGAPTVLSRIHDISDSLATKPMRDNSVQQRSPPKSQNPWGTQSRTGSRQQ